MKLEWKKLIVKTTVWLTVEIILNLLGLDNLADYSEFIYEHKSGGLGCMNQCSLVRRYKNYLSFSSGVFSYNQAS